MKAIGGIIGIIIVIIILGGIVGIIVQGSKRTPNPCNEMLVVTRNETVASISQRCGVDTNTIYNLNPGLLEDTNAQTVQTGALQAGMVLLLREEVTVEDAAEAIVPEPPTATPSF